MPIWKKAKCPVEGEQKQWIESRFQWLIDEFGLQQLRNAQVILPTPSFFPDPYDGSEPAVRRLLDRICGYMSIDPDRIEMSLYDEARQADVVPGVQVVSMGEGGSAGMYENEESEEKELISIEISNLNNMTSVIATCAHELGHVILLGDQHVTQETPDHEPLTDLLTVFWGMGIFNANSVIQDTQWTDGNWSGWSVGRQGYLDEPAYAWALALFAWMREEMKPAWMKYLRLEVRNMAKKGLRYLIETQDAALKPADRE